MVVLVGILMLNRLPLIGGEPGVQITHLIKFSYGEQHKSWSDTLFRGSRTSILVRMKLHMSESIPERWICMNFTAF